VGCSNFSAWHVMKSLGIAHRHGLPVFASQQIHYSLQSREAEYELVPLSLDQGLGILVWSPLAGGLLSGKYRRGEDGPEGARHLTDWDEPPVYDTDALYDVVDVLVEVGEAHGVSAARVALAWLLGRPGVTSLVIGARTEEQLADNLGAARGGQPPAAALPVLAPGQDRVGPPVGGRPLAAGLTRRLRRRRPGRPRPSGRRRGRRTRSTARRR
jgi:aryl-alcohol dehydrogenase-like predicted oxidoreductase